MLEHWILRRAHKRKLPNGGTTNVRPCYVHRPPKKDRQRERYTRDCPYCRAQIISVPMPNGGWAHFEGGQGLSTIKHPCFQRGEGIKTGKDDQTPDFFEDK